MELTWYTFPDFLIEQFPHLREEIESEYFSYLNFVANPYPHVFLSSFLAPMILGRTSDSGTDRQRAGEVLDLVLNADDDDLAEAALLEVLENLVKEPELLAEAWPWLGPAAREWIGKLQRS